jgi:eukaryotic-like serine/threonine-protein kinase
MSSDIEGSGPVCTTCGTRYAPGAKYCGIDGTALLTPREAVSRSATSAHAKQRKYCPVCGLDFPAYAQFCPTDAAKLGNQPMMGGASSAQASAGPSTEFALYGNEDADEKLVGKSFAGKYFIESLLGEGGMAKVYKATNTEIDKTVVIKLMRNEVSPKERETSLKRFLQEIKVTARLNHPNLVSVLDGGEHNGRRFLVMEYIQGETLRVVMTRRGMMPYSDAIRIICQVCAGLQEAHNEGIVHRDLKPENIMIRENQDRPDWVKIVDFGIAHLKAGGSKLTATGIAIGTVDYMSPEYLSDKPIDHRADIYALGVMLFELLTGRCPFESECTEALLAKHLWSAPMPPSSYRKEMQAGCALDRIVERALEKEPANRYQSTTEMRQALLEAVSNPDRAPVLEG